MRITLPGGYIETEGTFTNAATGQVRPMWRVQRDDGWTELCYSREYAEHALWVYAERVNSERVRLGH